MRKRIAFICFCLCILLGACVSQSFQTILPIEETFTPTVAKEVPTPSSQVEADSTQPTNPTPTVLQHSEVNSPVFVFLKKNTLMMQVNEISPKPVGILTDLGEIKDTLLANDTLYLIRENGIQRINLTNGSSDIVLRFDVSISSGKLLWDFNHSRIFYDVITSTARDSLIGYYDLDGNFVHPVLSYKDPLVTLQLIGVTEDGKGLYCLPHGQDPDFGKILLLNIDQGTISRELPVRGYNYAVLAPDSRYLATSAQVIDASDQLTNMINIYDLPSLPMTSPKIFKLPILTSMIGNNGFYWSPDGKRLYFMLIENKDDPSISISDGLWVLDVETGSTHKVADIPDLSMYTSGINPDGLWILVRSTTKDETFLVNTQTEEVRPFSIPLEAILAGWQ